jgi:hypothetical protein
VTALSTAASTAKLILIVAAVPGLVPVILTEDVSFLSLCFYDFTFAAVVTGLD